MKTSQNIIKTCLISFAAILTLCQVCFSQTDTVLIVGRTTNGKGTPLPGVLVSLAKRKVFVTSDSGGYFTVTNRTGVLPYGKNRQDIPIKFINNCLVLSLSVPGPVNISLTNSAGKTVKTIADGMFQKGSRTFNIMEILSRGHACGVYFLRCRTGASENIYRLLFTKTGISFPRLYKLNLQQPLAKQTQSSSDLSDTVYFFKTGYISKKINITQYQENLGDISLNRGGLEIIHPSPGKHETFTILDTMMVVVKMDPEDYYAVNLDWKMNSVAYATSSYWTPLQLLSPPLPGKDSMRIVVPVQYSYNNTNYFSCSNACRIRARTVEDASIFAISDSFSTVPEAPRVGEFRFIGILIGLGYYEDSTSKTSYVNYLGQSGYFYCREAAREVLVAQKNSFSITTIDCGPSADNAAFKYDSLVNNKGPFSKAFVSFDKKDAWFYCDDTTTGFFCMAYAHFGKFVFVISGFNGFNSSQAVFEISEIVLRKIKERYDSLIK
jgi:hypothetical protein